MKPFVLLTLSLIGAPAAATEPFQSLRSGAVDCAEQHAGALERILDARKDDEKKAAVTDAVVGGSCDVKPVATEVTQVRALKTPAGNAYACFHEIDAADHDDLGSYCTANQFVTTIAAELGRRKGDYTISKDDASTIHATCAEGGMVFIRKKPDRWERASAVFPKRLDPPVRAVASDRETALRAGCRGVDYQP